VRIEREASEMSGEDLAYLNRMIDFVPIYLALTDAGRQAVVDRMRVEAPELTFAVVHAYWIGWIHSATHHIRHEGVRY
jgi:hypothetical protein